MTTDRSGGMGRYAIRTVARAGVAAMAGLLALGLPSAGQSPGVVEVPLGMEGGRLVVSVVGDTGGEYRFALSTGSPVTVLSESMAGRLADIGGLRLGTVSVPTAGAATVPDARLQAGGRALDGMIGPNLLNQFDVLLDVPGGRLVLKPFGRAVEWEGLALSEPVRLRVFHGVVVSLDIELGGRSVPAMLDLGTPGVVGNEGLRTALGLEADDPVTLGVGGAVFPNQPFRVEDLEVLRRFSPDGTPFALVGASFLSDCAVSLSWVHSELRTCLP